MAEPLSPVGIEATTQAPPSAPSATPAPSAPEVTTPSVPSTPPSAPSGTPGVPATHAAPSSPSWLQSLRKNGLDLPDDENVATQRLTEIYQQRQALEQIRPLVPHVQNYLRDAQSYNEWRAQQAAAAQKPSPEDPFYKPYFNPPEFQESWLNQVTKDAQGNLVPIPGAPHDVAIKVQQYQNFQAEQAKKFLQNPHEYMKPTIETIARKIAQEAIQGQFSQVNDRQSSHEFVQKNTGWLYEIDQATGQPKKQAGLNPMNGQRMEMNVLSPWGQRFSQYVQEISQRQTARGYQDVEEQKQIALAQIQRDYAIFENEQYRAGKAPSPQSPAAAPSAPPTRQLTPQEAANAAFLAKQNPASPPPRGNAVPGEKKVVNKNLRQEMMSAMQAAGITDQNFK